MDDVGREFPLERRGYIGGNGLYTFTFAHRAKIPANGTIIAEIFDQLERFEVPFKIENVDLLGRSR